MEREDDVQLVRAVLEGDDSAFGTLVEKYEKSVHTLAWQQLGDFHYAEEITQDTFLRAYQKLSTLKDPSRFSNWLYKIATNCCRNWLREQKRKNQSQSLEDTSMAEVARSNYDRYVSEQREAEATEHRFEIVKKLLDKLPEGEREAMVLYYLGEMSTVEVGKFLGVSVEAVRLRLSRARKRLEEEEELLIQEVLGGVQIPSSIRQNIMRQVVEMNPAPPSRISPKMEPFLPWTVLGIALVVATLLIFSVSDFGNPYLAYFQKLYSSYFADDAEGTKSAKNFTADFTIILGARTSGADLLQTLIEEKCLVSQWSIEALGNLDTIYNRAKQLGLETCPVETAPQLRLRFLDQPDYATGERLGEFFVASEPFVLTRDGFPKIFSVGRDDMVPHPETGIGLWLISNDIVNAGNKALPDRLFNASDSNKVDYGGRFAFVLPR